MFTDKTTEELWLLIGDSLRKLRQVKGITQKTVAEALGVSTISVYLWEQGKKPIGKRSRVKLLDYFGIIGYDPSEEKKEMAKRISQSLIKERGLFGKNQSWVANNLGLTRQAYSTWELGLYIPTPESCEKLEIVFNLRIGHFRAIIDEVKRDSLTRYNKLLENEYLMLTEQLKGANNGTG